MDAADSKIILLQELSNLIRNGNAHASLEDAVAGITNDQAVLTTERLPYNIWQLVEHLRIAQWDILEFCVNPLHKSPEWPSGYWVPAAERPDEDQWSNSLWQIKADRESFLQVLHAQDAELFQPIKHGTGQNLLREALLIADHNAYHIGQIIVLRRLLGLWK
ncbi:DinB family protein [Pedobacter sp.]|uniref:DinB family protein n=1 Tax=Pedobacter sp. TaxID=1411316 RepID=UPI003D7FA2C9